MHKDRNRHLLRSRFREFPFRSTHKTSLLLLRYPHLQPNKIRLPEKSYRAKHRSESHAWSFRIPGRPLPGKPLCKPWQAWPGHKAFSQSEEPARHDPWNSDGNQIPGGHRFRRDAWPLAFVTPFQEPPDFRYVSSAGVRNKNGAESGTWGRVQSRRTIHHNVVAIDQMQHA